MGSLQEEIAQLEDQFLLGEILKEDYQQRKRQLLEELHQRGELLSETGKVKIAEIKDKRDVPFCFVPEGGFFYGPDNRWEETKCGFYISKYPVLVSEFKEFLQNVNIGYTDEDYERLSLVSPEDDCPASHLSYNDAKEFCRWLRRETGEYYSLPHEIEWEKSARGEDGRIYPWGYDEVTAEHACYQGEIGYNCSVPVTLFEHINRSPYGCVDMVGNVWEWCLDSFEDPRDPHILRGGSWCNTAEYINCLSRTFTFPPDKRIDYGGFRVIYLPADLLEEYRTAYSEQGKKSYVNLRVVRITKEPKASETEEDRKIEPTEPISPRMKQLSQIFDKAAARAAQVKKEEDDLKTEEKPVEKLESSESAPDLDDALAQAIHEAANLLLRKHKSEQIVDVTDAKGEKVLKNIQQVRLGGETASSEKFVRPVIKYKPIAEIQKSKEPVSEKKENLPKLEFEEDAHLEIERATPLTIPRGVTYLTFVIWLVLLCVIILLVILRLW